MQDDLDAAYPGLKIDIQGVNAAGHESANSLMISGRNRPWLQDVDANSNGLSDLWDDSWDIEYRDVIILDGDNVQVGVYNLTVNSLGVATNYSALREMLVDAAMTVQKPWHNKTKPVDVTGDGQVVPQDALFIINSLTSDGSRELAPPTTATFNPPYYDTDGDNFIAPIDALLVVNHLNAFGAGEGEFTALQLSAEPLDVAPALIVAAPSLDWSLLDATTTNVAVLRTTVVAPTLASLTNDLDDDASPPVVGVAAQSNSAANDGQSGVFANADSAADLDDIDGYDLDAGYDLDDVLTSLAQDVAAQR